MRNRKLILLGVSVMVIVGAGVLWLSAGHSTSSSVTVSFVRYITNDAGQRRAVFRVANQSQVTVVCSATCSTEVKDTGKIADGTCPDMRIQPGGVETFTMTRPGDLSAWRVGVSQYGLDTRNKLRIGLDMSLFSRFLPREWQSVAGPCVWSEWITE